MYAGIDGIVGCRGSLDRYTSWAIVILVSTIPGRRSSGDVPCFVVGFSTSRSLEFWVSN